MEKVVDYFKKFYGMKPYLSIDEKEWRYIITTYEKDELVDELSEMSTYISMSDTRDYRKRNIEKFE